MIEQKTKSGSSRRERMLARAIARRCRGRTLVLGNEFAALVERLREQKVDETAGRFGEVGPEKLFDTVVLVRALEYRAPDTAAVDLAAAHALLAERGTLLVCVPNENHVKDPDVRQRFDRRGLKRLLKGIDQPKVYTDQPFGWLLMALSTDPRTDRTTEERHRVIAGLCRGSVLELGCAAGHLSKRIADRGLDVAGVDKNASKVAKASRLFPGIDFKQADILDLPVERRYGTVVLAEVLEHMPEEVGSAMLSKAWDLAEPGGRLVVSVPNEDCVPHKNHLCEFTAAGLRGILARFGRPKIVVDQPYKWLLMYVTRPA